MFSSLKQLDQPQLQKFIIPSLAFLFLVLAFLSSKFPGTRYQEPGARNQETGPWDLDPGTSIPTQGFSQILGSTENKSTELPQIIAPPYLSNNPLPFPQVSATSYEIYDRESRTEILGFNQHQKVAPASLTKLLTAIVALKSLKLDDIVEVKEPVINGSNMGLLPYEKIRFESLLWGLLLPSGNDAAYAVAQAVGAMINYSDDPQANERKFVEEMNKEAEFLYLNESHFANPAGLDQAEHYSTAFDLARLADYAIRFPIISSIVQTPSATIKSTDDKIIHELKNTNDLLGKIQGVVGIKTGTTQNSGQSIILNVNREGHEVIFVILGSKDRDTDAKNLIEWVFGNYKW